MDYIRSGSFLRVILIIAITKSKRNGADIFYFYLKFAITTDS